ncbi:hypothetical protein E4N62_06325 [Streptomyces sp. MNU76]|uniref:ABC transporter permease subunit n=1 Tax=Streptomyces sp. MNU76 TaxID=2560026 RepID=UPI001E41E76C|nr:hypothetical protein [Streptomyces sp. MNU76]MCC9704904.1 hypothetical protein [Streptomyces sp. MNU76]
MAIRPTNGVDVKSKEFLLRRIRQVADGGKAALIVSDELDHLKVCDRLVVMFQGRAVAEFDRGWRRAGGRCHGGGGRPGRDLRHRRARLRRRSARRPRRSPVRRHRRARKSDSSSRRPSCIVTLGRLTVLRGLKVALSEGQSIVELQSSFAYLGKASWLGVPAAIWICVVLFALGGGAPAWLRHGRALYASGGNAEAARTAGIRVDRIVWAELILGSVPTAFAGILYSGHSGSISAAQGSGWIFQVFAATVIGGVSLNGGRGSIFGAITGVLTLQLVVGAAEG